MLSELQNVKLKKTTPVRSNAAVPLICANSEDYIRLMEETHMERYIAQLEQQQLTFASFFVPFTPALCRQLHDAHKQWKKDASWNFAEHEAEYSKLAELAAAITEGMQQRGWGAVFVRLSSRSPKDAALVQPSFKPLFQQHYRKLCADERYVASGTVEEKQNAQLVALYIASIKALECKEGAQCVQLLVESERIQGDLEELQRVPAKIDDFAVCVRQFASFTPELEFRGFVYGKKLTALTQYNQFVFSPLLVQHKAQIERTLRACFQRLSQIIHLPNYVIDFVLIAKDGAKDEFSDLQPYVVELNPFAEFAGFGMFSWERESDRNVLLGKAPFEMRVAEKIPTLASHEIDGTWKRCMEEATASDEDE